MVEKFYMLDSWLVNIGPIWYLQTPRKAGIMSLFYRKGNQDSGGLKYLLKAKISKWQIQDWGLSDLGP